MASPRALLFVTVVAGCGVFSSVDRRLVADAGGGFGGDEDGAGGVDCTSPEECPGSDDECKRRTCELGVCGIDFAVLGAPCDEGACDGNGHCVAPRRPAAP
jgi:hypothetical protein